MISAVLDACVLYPAPLRDFLLRLAEDKLISPFWSEKIQDEWTYHLLRNYPDSRPERIRRKMSVHFPNSIVQGYESVTPTLQLPDQKDRHVLATAIYVKAEYIVTFNLKHFPESALQPHGIEAISPDEIVLRIVQKRPIRILLTIKKHRAGFKRPPLSVDEYLTMLERQGLAQTVAFLREHLADI